MVMTLDRLMAFGPNGEITPLSARTTGPLNYPAMMEGGTAKFITATILITPESGGRHTSRSADNAPEV